MDEKMINYEHGSSTESVFSGFGSSSGLNTPAGSDLDSLESEEDDFMAELTRQMAENMLLEDDDDKPNPPSPVSDNPTQSCQHEKKAHFQHQPRNREYGFAHARRSGFVSATQAGSGMRVVFLGSKNGSSSGTGVFLPSQTTNNNINTNPPYDHQYRKKTVCSTVLIPERVLQTLKQHFEKRSNANGGMQSHEQQNQRLQSRENNNNNQDLQLPQEWTY